MRRLPTIDAKNESLGLATIMDRALAQQHGVAYVHLAAFAIDVDRVRDRLDRLDEGDDASDDLPMGWEVFLTERYLESRVEVASEAGHALVEDVVLAIFDLPPSEEPVYGSQLPFAVWHAVSRGALPKTLDATFSTWRARPKELGKGLDRLYADRDASTRTLARRCLDTPLDPPLAPPTREALEAFAA